MFQCTSSHTEPRESLQLSQGVCWHFDSWRVEQRVSPAGPLAAAQRGWLGYFKSPLR